MSEVTYAVLHLSWCSDGFAVSQAIASRAFRKDERGYDDQFFAALPTGDAGGSKSFNDEVFAAAFNYVAPSQIADWFERLPWDEHDVALLSMDREGDEQLVVFRAGGRSRRMSNS